MKNVIIMQLNSGGYESYSYGLIPWVHYIPVDHLFTSITSVVNWALNKSNEKNLLQISKNADKDEVLGYYPLAYNGAELDKFWMIAAWEDPTGRLLLKEMTLKTFLNKSTKDIIEKEFLGESRIGKQVKSKINSVAKKDYWTLISIMACENFPDNVQGMSDVAQSIYNRYLNAWSYTLKNLVYAYDPEYLILGGGVMTEGENLRAYFQTFLDKANWLNHFTVKVVLAKNPDWAGVIGAAILAQEKEIAH